MDPIKFEPGITYRTGSICNAMTWAFLRDAMLTHGWVAVGAFRFETGEGDHATMDAVTGRLVIVTAN